MQENNIPKVIHYCRFWKWKKTIQMKKCISSWKKHCPDYEIKEWNEENFDVNLIYYTRNLYKKWKFAFVADYSRIHILYNHWWIYFDTDVEIIKNFDDLLFNEAFTGFQDNFSIGWAIIWAKKWNKTLKEILDYYKIKKIRIILPNLLWKIFKKYWNVKYSEKPILLNNFTIYPKDYFYPFAYFEKPENMQITKNTYTIHHYDATWLPKIVTKIFFPIIWFINKLNK